MLLLEFRNYHFGREYADKSGFHLCYVSDTDYILTHFVVGPFPLRNPYPDCSCSDEKNSWTITPRLSDTISDMAPDLKYVQLESRILGNHAKQ